MVRKLKLNIEKHIKITSEQMKKYFDNEFLNFFFLNKKQIYSKNRRDLIINIPKKFSLIDNFDAVMEIIDKIGDLRFSSKNLVLDFSLCKEVDFSASSLLIVVLLNIEEERKKNRSGLGIKLKSNKKIQNALYINGIIEYLDISLDNNGNKVIFPEVEKERKKNFKNLYLIGSGRNKIEFSDTLIKRKLFTLENFSGLEDKTINFINESMKTKNVSLNLEGKNKFREIITEIIDNSKIHLGKTFNQYFMMGNYYNSDIGRESLLFFNFGDTIYQTLKKTESEEIKNLINDLVDHHNKNNNFDITFTQEALIVLMAIQDKISSLYTQEDSRGTGTTKMIRNFLSISNFNTLHEKDSPRAFILSGHVQIKLDKNVKKWYDNNMEVGDTLGFNSENSLEYKPDVQNVMVNKSNYPGTLILIEFNLDERFLRGGVKNE